MFKMNTKGFDDLQKQLKNMQKAAKKLDGTHTVPLGELLNTRFMRKYTNFSSLDEMLEQFGYGKLSQKEFENIPENEIDSKVAETTRFKGWDDMMEKATEQYVSKKLGF